MKLLVPLSLALLLVGAGCKDDPVDTGPGPSGDDDDAWLDDIAVLEQGGVQSCLDSGARSLAKFDRKTSPNPPNTDIWLWGGGEIVGDLNGDGTLDVILPNEIAKANLLSGTGPGTYEELPETLADFDLSLGTGGTVVDYDSDGDLDVYILLYDAANVLLRNDGDFHFTDVTLEAGVTGCEPDGSRCYKSMSSSWADYDRDGDLDLIVGNYGFVLHDGTNVADFDPGEPSFLYANNGDGTFTDVTDQLLPKATMQHVHDGYTYVAGFHDLDMDGWPELYFVNDFGNYQLSTLLWNVEGTFVLDNNLHALDQNLTGMGLALGDINRDGYPDLLIPEWNKNAYLESSWVGEQLLWVGKDQDKGLIPNNAVNQKVGWGAEWGDVDNDGDLDAIMAYGYVKSENEIWDNPFRQPDGLYLQDENQRFSDQSLAWGTADDGVGRGFVVADFNNDGYLDIAKRDLAGANVLQLSRCGDNGWLRIGLRAPNTANHFAIGAVVRATVDGETQQRVITAGGTNYASGGPPEVHFGFGETEGIDSLSIRWPDGRDSTFRDVPTHQILTVTQDR